MQLHRLIDVMERIAPTQHAESWDNVGLLTGDPLQEISAVLLAIDYTRDVADEGKRLGCNAVIAYHPPIFHPLKRLVAGSLVFDAIRRGVAIYSPHTALDVAEEGTNDVLCDVLGIANRSPLKLAETKTKQCKLVTFVPESAVEKVGQAPVRRRGGPDRELFFVQFSLGGNGNFFRRRGNKPGRR